MYEITIEVERTKGQRTVLVDASTEGECREMWMDAMKERNGNKAIKALGPTRMISIRPVLTNSSIYICPTTEETR